MLNPEEIWHEQLTDLSTPPVKCSHFTVIFGCQAMQNFVYLAELNEP